MRSLGHDVRLALRRLRLAPGFTLFAVASLALGIGAATLVYSTVRTLWWPPLGVPDASRLIGLGNGGATQFVSWPDFQDLRHDQTRFSAIAATAAFPVAIGAGAASQTVLAGAVSGDYFAVTGLRPHVGRLLAGPDDASAARVAVLSEYFWRTNFSGDPAIVGRAVKIGGENFEIVGVIDGVYHGLQPFSAESVWIPVTSVPASSGFRLPPHWREQRAFRAFSVWGRLRSPADFAPASAETAVIGRRLDQMYPVDPARGRPRQWSLRANATSPPDGESRDSVIVMILTAIVMVLLIACTNLANLALAKETSRAQEAAVRSALGASRWRLIREHLVESGFVVAVGGGCGIVLSLAVADYAAVDIPLSSGVSIRLPQVDVSLFVAAIVAMALVLGVFGLWPALQSTRVDVRSRLGAGASATMPKWRLHRNIIAWQVCGSVALLLVALLAVRIVTNFGGGNFARTAHSNLALAQVDFGLNGLDESRMRSLTAAIMGDLHTHVAQEPVAATNAVPYGFLSLRDLERPNVTTAEFAVGGGQGGRGPGVVAATPSFLVVVGLELLRGRQFTEQDDASASRVAIVNETAARDLFHTTDVVGRTIYVAPALAAPTAGAVAAARPRPQDVPPLTTTVIGVCRDDRPWLSAVKPDAVIFVPFPQRYAAPLPITFVARGSVPSRALADLRASIRRTEPDLAITMSGFGRVLLDGPLFILRVIVAMTTSLGVLALVLSMAGLFGVLTHLVSTRTREIGVRLALGADRADILRLILRDGLQPVCKGLVLGLFIGAAARVAVKTFVVSDVSAFDLTPIVLLPIPFLLAALAASYLPAARAARVEPTVALRDL